MAAAPTHLRSTPVGDYPKCAQVYGSHGSPGDIDDLTFDIRVTFWSGAQREYPGMKTAVRPPPQYDGLDLIGAGPGQEAGIGYVGDDFVFYVAVWPDLGDCEDAP